MMSMNPVETPINGIFTGAAAGTQSPPSFRERWRLLKLAHCAVPNYGNSRQFWGKKKNIDTVYVKGGHTNHDGITECRLASMNIRDGSRVLDIGAGPGTYAIPLAKRGCQITAVEPSPVMRDLLTARIEEEQVGTIAVIPKRWEDVSPEELGAPFDTVIASFSLTMMDMGKALARMHAASNGSVHLFWFLTSPAWAQVNQDLWPHLHGGSFPGEPTADWLWQILYEMGICANIQPEPRVSLSRYASVDEAVEEYRQRLNCTTPAHEEIVRNYFNTVLRQDINGYILGSGTRSAHIWWNIADQQEREWSR
jgi:SAM-dependent methyltransferase